MSNYQSSEFVAYSFHIWRKSKKKAKRCQKWRGQIHVLKFADGFPLLLLKFDLEASYLYNFQSVFLLRRFGVKLAGHEQETHPT